MTKYKVIIDGFDISLSVVKVELTGNGPGTGFTLYLNDKGNVSQQPQIRIGALTSIFVNQLDTDNPNDFVHMMDGRIDKPTKTNSSPTAVSDRKAIIQGRTVSRDLFRLLLIGLNQTKFLTNSSPPATLNDVFAKSLEYTESELHVLSFDPNFNPNLPVNIEPNDRYLVDIYDETKDAVGCGYTVDYYNKQLVYWPLNNIPSTNILLKNLPENLGNNILEVLNQDQDGSSIQNYHILKAGSLIDQWTEENAQYLTTSGPNVTLQNDYTVYIVGKASIKANCNNTYYSQATTVWGNIDDNILRFPFIRYQFPLFDNPVLDVSAEAELQCHVNVSHTFTGKSQPDNCPFVICITDTLGNKLYWFKNGIKNNTSGSGWHKLDFTLGFKSPRPSNFTGFTGEEQWVPSKYNLGSQNTDKFNSFNWKIVSLDIGFFPYYTSSLSGVTIGDPSGAPGYWSGSFWIDGLNIPSLSATRNYVIHYDQESIDSGVGKSMGLVNRPDCKSITQMNTTNFNLLQAKKNQFEKLSLITTFQQDLRYCGLTLNIHYPELGIATGVNMESPVTYIIMSYTHVLAPGENLSRGHDLITRLELIRYYPGESNIILANRITQAFNASYAEYLSHDTRLAIIENNNATSGNNNGGNSKSETFNGGTINNSLVVQCKMPFLNEQNNDVFRWLMTPFTDLQDYSAYVRFNNIAEPWLSVENQMQHLDLYAAVVSNGSAEQVAAGQAAANPGLMVGHHLMFRGDVIGRGMVRLLEGALVLSAGLIPEGVPGTGQRVRGWGPPGYNPMIWLTEGAKDPAASTLEIRLYDTTNGWTWGNFEANSITSHGSVNTSHLRSQDGLGFIGLYNAIVPFQDDTVELGQPTLKYRNIYGVRVTAGYVTAVGGVATDWIDSVSNSNLTIRPWTGRSIILDGNVTVTGTMTGGSNPFDQQLNTWNQANFIGVRTTGGIECQQNLDVFQLRAYPYNNSNKIILGNGLTPYQDNIMDLGAAYAGFNTVFGTNLGTQQNPFQNTYGVNVYGKNPYSFGCERSKSGKEWLQEIQDEDEALNILTYEVTKTLKHVTYSTEKEDEIICICGKSVKHPCPEHLEEWNQTYCHNDRHRLEAVSFLTLENTVSIAQLQLKNYELTEYIKALTDRLIMLEKRLTIKNVNEVKTA